jgi:2-polyprenyl-6-methoxyphenol hydroxylase-like FAD-dependent oxidoreductase
MSGQGGRTAIEDALVLAKPLSAQDTAEDGGECGPQPSNSRRRITNSLAV